VKLVIQIPCLNEEVTLPATLADLPRALPGIATIEILVVDDGSRDRTGEVARAHGVHRVVRFAARRGLAAAFARGLQEALAMGADVIVNTDADNQYRGEDIARLIQPILDGRADMVVGDRQVETVREFSPLKRRLQKLGSSIVTGLANTTVPDATSGFRAYSREAAMRLTVLTDFTYTIETLIQAAQKNISIASVPIRTNPKTRESRLFHGMAAYIQRSVATMIRVYVLYRPLRIFLGLSGACLAAAAVLMARFAYFLAIRPDQPGHVQSVVVAGAFAIMGVLFGALGILSDLTAMNRRLLEEILTHARALRYGTTTRDLRDATGPGRRAPDSAAPPPAGTSGG
jgi:glycosyltransferase involved in cell wall biosynthesis